MTRHATHSYVQVEVLLVLNTLLLYILVALHDSTPPVAAYAAARQTIRMTPAAQTNNSSCIDDAKMKSEKYGRVGCELRAVYVGFRLQHRSLRRITRAGAIP